MNNTIAKPTPTRRKPSNSNTYSPYPVTIFTTPQQNKTGFVGFISKAFNLPKPYKSKKKTRKLSPIQEESEGGKKKQRKSRKKKYSKRKTLVK